MHWHHLGINNPANRGPVIIAFTWTSRMMRAEMRALALESHQTKRMSL